MTPYDINDNSKDLNEDSVETIPIKVAYKSLASKVPTPSLGASFQFTTFEKNLAVTTRGGISDFSELSKVRSATKSKSP